VDKNQGDEMQKDNKIKEIIEEILPLWFMEKYKLELEATFERDRYWVELGDTLRLLKEGKELRKQEGRKQLLEELQDYLKPVIDGKQLDYQHYIKKLLQKLQKEVDGK